MLSSAELQPFNSDVQYEPFNALHFILENKIKPMYLANYLIHYAI